MDTIRIGRAIRALRVRRGWRQEDLARTAGVSRTVVGRLERGDADGIVPRRIERVVAALGARLVVRLDWHGEGLDRLLDAGHAAIVEAVVRELQHNGWLCATEVTFNVFGERGSIDVLAFHPEARIVLVIEVKSTVPDVGGMLLTLDRKTRLALRIAAERGWSGRSVARLLVVAEGPTARRRVAAHRATFDQAFPARNVAIRRWLAQPVGPLSGLWFFSNARGPAPRGRPPTDREGPRA